MAGLAHYLTLDSIQVPLDLNGPETFTFVGVLPFCVAEQSSHELALSRQLLANGQVRDLEVCHIHLGLCDTAAERGQFRSVGHDQLHRQHADVCPAQHSNAIARVLRSTAIVVGVQGRMCRR